MSARAGGGTSEFHSVALLAAPRCQLLSTLPGLSHALLKYIPEKPPAGPDGTGQDSPADKSDPPGDAFLQLVK